MRVQRRAWTWWGGGILALVLAGVVINVLVAWACAIWSPLPRQKRPDAWWPGSVPEGWEHPGSAIVRASFGVSDLSAMHIPIPSSSDHSSTSFWMRQTGLPMRALFRQRQRREAWTAYYAPLSSDSFGTPAPSSWANGLTLPRREWRSARRVVYLPVRPLWPGFLVNTGLYAVLVGMLVCGLVAARRNWRRWGNRCASCGYDLHGNSSGVCPECGKAVRG